MHRAEAIELAGLQRHRRIVAQMRPLLPGEDPVRVILLFRCPNIHDAAYLTPRDVQLVALARGLLFKAGHAGALRQRGLDFLKPDATRLQQHQQVKQHDPRSPR